jgi:hypothetical protein
MAQLEVPKGSEAKAKYHLNQLRKMFARANDHAFLQMIWAIDALQDDREDVASQYLKTYPKAAAQSTLESGASCRTENHRSLLRYGCFCDGPAVYDR